MIWTGNLSEKSRDEQEPIRDLKIQASIQQATSCYMLILLRTEERVDVNKSVKIDQAREIRFTKNNSNQLV